MEKSFGCETLFLDLLIDVLDKYNSLVIVIYRMKF